MKHICTFLWLLVLLLYGCDARPQYENELPSTSDTIHTSAKTEETVSFDAPIDLGIPYFSLYAAYPLAMTPSDLIVYDRCLLVSSGDWGGNMGPIDMLCYDIVQNEWRNSGTLQDEEIAVFFVINDNLVTPGIDPRDGWEWGNLYFLQNGTWQTKRTIPNGIHCFDLAYHEGALFAAVKTSDGGLQAAVSRDMGDSFSLVPLIKDGSPVTAVDMYFDLFVIGEAVYAYCCHELYRYNGTSFVCETSWQNKIKTKYYNTPQKLRMFRAEANIGDTLYFTTGKLYSCTNTNDVRTIDTPNGELVYDIYMHDGGMYLLCDLKTDTGYTMTVYRYIPEGEQFVTETAFASDIPAISLAVDDGSYYFGMASNNYKKQNHGRIFKIEKEP